MLNVMKSGKNKTPQVLVTVFSSTAQKALTLRIQPGRSGTKLHALEPSGYACRPFGALWMRHPRGYEEVT